jgi:hypothetical protein
VPRFEITVSVLPIALDEACEEIEALRGEVFNTLVVTLDIPGDFLLDIPLMAAVLQIGMGFCQGVHSCSFGGVYLPCSCPD